MAELCMEDVGPQQSYMAVPRGTDSSQSSPFLLPHAIKALFSTTMTRGNLHPLLKCPFQGRWDNTKSTPLKPPDPQPHRRAGLHPSLISCGHTGGWRTGRSPGHGAASAASQEAPGPAGSVPRPSVPPWGPWLALGARDLAPRWSREPLGTAATASPMEAWEPRRRERRGPGDKVPFQPEPWKDVCVCVCAEVNALGPGERRGESTGWLHPHREPGAGPARVPLCVPACASVCRRFMHFRLGVFMYVMCVSYSSLCFSFLVPGSFPHPRRGSIILMAFYSFLYFLRLNLQFWKWLSP